MVASCLQHLADSSARDRILPSSVTPHRRKPVLRRTSRPRARAPCLAPQLSFAPCEERPIHAAPLCLAPAPRTGHGSRSRSCSAAPRGAGTPLAFAHCASRPRPAEAPCLPRTRAQHRASVWPRLRPRPRPAPSLVRPLAPRVCRRSRPAPCARPRPHPAPCARAAPRSPPRAARSPAAASRAPRPAPRAPAPLARSLGRSLQLAPTRRACRGRCPGGRGRSRRGCR